MRRTRLPSEHDVDPREISKRSFEFSVAVLRLAQQIGNALPESVVRQLVNHGTRVGAGVADAHGSGTHRGYVSGLAAARRSARRAAFWLRLIGAAEGASQELIEGLIEDAQALHTTLTALGAKAHQTKGPVERD